MGVFDIFKPHKKAQTDIGYIQNELQSSGTFQNRHFNPSNEFNIEKSSLSIKPHGVSQPEAQRALAKIEIGASLQLLAGQAPSGCPALLVKTLAGALIGDIQCSYSENCRMLYDMIKAGVKIDCSLSQKGQFYSDNLEKKIWWCEIFLPFYDVWSITGASVWATKGGRLYHCDSSCNKKADRHMTLEEVEYRGMNKCPKCYHFQPEGPSISQLYRLSAQMTGKEVDYSIKIDKILQSSGRDISEIESHFGLHSLTILYKDTPWLDFFNVKLEGKLRYITLFVSPESVQCDYICTAETLAKGEDYCRIYVPSPDSLDSISQYIVAAFDRAKSTYEKRIVEANPFVIQ